jgi:hypothetical protein
MPDSLDDRLGRFIKILKTRPPYDRFALAEDWDQGLNQLVILERFDDIKPPQWPGSVLATNLDLIQACVWLRKELKEHDYGV